MAFLVKADLETNVEALVQEIDFLKGLYEEVPAAMLPTGGRSGPVREDDGGEALAQWVHFRASRLRSRAGTAGSQQ